MVLCSPQVSPAASEISSLGLAAVFHGLDSETASFWDAEAKCGSGSERGWTGIRVPQQRRERGKFLFVALHYVILLFSALQAAVTGRQGGS